MTHIRSATPDDLESIREVLRAAYAPYLSIPGLPDVTDVQIEDLARMKVWLAEMNGANVGVAMATANRSIAHLANVAVAPDAGGRGIGRSLIDTVVSWAQQEGCSEIQLATHPDMGSNVAIYERLGWRVTDRSDSKVTLSRPL